MNKIQNIHCKVSKPQTVHCNQIFTGFYILNKTGIIDLEISNLDSENDGFFDVVINSKLKIRYDLLDGFNWVNKTSEIDNLKYFKTVTKGVDFYFKRSFQPSLYDFASPTCKLFPLGFNFNVVPSPYFFLKSDIDSLINTPRVLVEKLIQYSQENIPENIYVHPPADEDPCQILFYTRLWDPHDHTDNPDFASELKDINFSRISAIEKCRKEFGKQFSGGLYDSPLARRMAPHLILEKRKIRKLNYLKKVKKSNICIATRGLHNSTGWKFAEYIAVSRAIVTEPLTYTTTGDFKCGRNFLEFNSPQSLISKIQKLLNDKSLRQNMMEANFEYYNSYLKPDQLVLNSLKKIFNSL
ncbi:glycosyltransferase [Litoribacter populi]|uniref:glycosyltransferase n=1 Tax=Litoribacter populi TaxID=2598460 RepID=UPI0011809BC5|nr:hypothetical protein [Litoribacter populi]